MKLPEIFKNKIDTINNNEKSFLSFNKIEIINKDDILNKLPVKVLLITNDKEIETTIVEKTKNYLFTNDNRIISIKNVKEIKKI